MYRLVRRCARAAALALGIIGPVFLGCTPRPIVDTVVVTALGLAGLLAGRRWKTAIAVLVLFGAMAALRSDSFARVELPEKAKTLEAGKYSGASFDKLGIVRAIVVIREPNIIIRVEAHAMPFAGLDDQIVWLESHETMRLQRVPDEPADDNVSRRLVRQALADALSGARPREELDLPEGAVQLDSGINSFYDMFPSEFDHACRIEDLKDGQYEGWSSNRYRPAHVRLTVKEGRLIGVDLLQPPPTSGHGEPALQEMPKRMLASSRIDADIISGASRTSYILRSAAYHACKRTKW